jgi:endonuclease YncB( thermonuclease family)
VLTGDGAGPSARRVRRARRSGTAVVLASFAACGSLATAALAAPAPPIPIEARVLAVLDGDSLRVRDVSGLEHEVRIAGIDAPEKDQPYSRQARQNLATLALDEDARLDVQPRRDRHGRLIAKVWVRSPDAPCSAPACPKTLDVGHAQIIAGLAWHYKRYEKDQSPQDRGAYSSDEEEARLRKRGLWADANPVPPEQWRQGLENGAVKKSRSDICHTPDMPSYRSVRYFTSFPTLEACLQSGGRVPKGSL